MSSLENMLNVMKPIRLYSLETDSLVYKELKSYAEGIDTLGEAAEELLRESFTQTAAGEGLSTYEKLLGPERSDLTTEKRRSMIAFLLRINENDFTPDGMKRYFESFGAQCEIEEDPAFFHVRIMPGGRTFSAAEQELIRSAAEEFLPCHLSYDIEFRITDWDGYDAAQRTFDQWDLLNFTWNRLDRFEEV